MSTRLPSHETPTPTARSCTAIFGHSETHGRIRLAYTVQLRIVGRGLELDLSRAGVFRPEEHCLLLTRAFRLVLSDMHCRHMGVGWLRIAMSRNKLSWHRDYERSRLDSSPARHQTPKCSGLSNPDSMSSKRHVAQNRACAMQASFLKIPRDRLAVEQLGVSTSPPLPTARRPGASATAEASCGRVAAFETFRFSGRTRRPFAPSAAEPSGGRCTGEEHSAMCE